jgi:hypothetical protein
MYDKTILRIVEKIYVNKSMHKRGLSKEIKIGMPSIDYALKKADKLLNKTKSGNQIRYSIDYSKKEITPILYSIEYLRLSRLPNKVRIAVNDFLRSLKEKPIISLLFGSYAKGRYNADSDIDVLLVYQKAEGKDIENTAKTAGMRTNVSISPVYMDYGDFRESFHNPTKKFFKNIREDKILINGIEWWRELLDEEA